MRGSSPSKEWRALSVTRFNKKSLSGWQKRQTIMPHLGLGYPKSSSLSNCHKKRYTISLVSGSRKGMSAPESLKFRSATQIIPLLLNTNKTIQTCVKINMCRSSSELIRYNYLSDFSNSTLSANDVNTAWLFEHFEKNIVNCFLFSRTGSRMSRRSVLELICWRIIAWKIILDPSFWDPTWEIKSFKSVFRFMKNRYFFCFFQWT